MKQYKIIVYVGCECHTKDIEAKSFAEAQKKAVDFGHKLSNFGNGAFLRSVCVKPIKQG